ncbi:MAG: hypothetical protein IKD22_02860 [Lentisphaeria bacterium]|nr:hypothetical protein [Lentisphaeria bacterium]
MFFPYCRSQEKISDGFKAAFDRLKTLDPEHDADEKLWQTRHKVVVRYTVPDGMIPGAKEYQVVWKYYREKRFFRYLFRPSLAFREWRGYKNVEALGIPCAKVLAAAENRRGVKLLDSVFVTEMVRNTGDGDDFCPGGKFENDTEIAREFAEKNLRLLAKLHKNDFVHGGFTPRNELYSFVPESDAVSGNRLRVVWIDLATCRKVPFFKRKKLQKQDVDCFLSMLKFSPGVEAGLRQIYHEELKKNG